MRFMIKSPKSNFRVLWRRVAVALVATTLFALAYGVASAQPGPRGPLGPPPGPRPGRGEVKRVPSERYYAGTALIESGQFSSAIRFYNSEIKDAVKAWHGCQRSLKKALRVIGNIDTIYDLLNELDY